MNFNVERVILSFNILKYTVNCYNELEVLNFQLIFTFWIKSLIKL